MKRYTVVWWEAAEEERLRLWLASSSRAGITDASRQIDGLLAAQGSSVGEQVHEGLYVLEVDPLRVQYSVEEENRIVRVWTVRFMSR